MSVQRERERERERHWLWTALSLYAAAAHCPASHLRRGRWQQTSHQGHEVSIWGSHQTRCAERVTHGSDERRRGRRRKMRRRRRMSKQKGNSVKLLCKWRSWQHTTKCEQHDEIQHNNQWINSVIPYSVAIFLIILFFEGAVCLSFHYSSGHQPFQLFNSKSKPRSTTLISSKKDVQEIKFIKRGSCATFSIQTTFKLISIHIYNAKYVASQFHNILQRKNRQPTHIRIGLYCKCKINLYVLLCLLKSGGMFSCLNKNTLLLLIGQACAHILYFSQTW